MTPHYYFTAAILRHLRPKPAALFCLIALMQSGKPENAEYLEKYTSFTDKTVLDALEFLQDEGWITRNGRYAWQIAKNAFQFPLMAQTESHPLEGALPAGGDGADQTPIALTDDSPTGRPVAGADLDPAMQKDSEILRLGESPSRRISGSPLASSRSFIKDSRDENLLPLASGPDPEILRVLDKFGIREPARSRLARLEHVTEELIEYHCANCERSGQAIYRIENNWPVEQKAETGEEKDRRRQQELLESWKKYINNEDETEE